jgi:hypothetical protein
VGRAEVEYHAASHRASLSLAPTQEVPVRISFFAVAAMLVACGPTAAERQADATAQNARKDCARTYSSSQKVFQDLLYSQGVAEVTFVDREKYIEKCVGLGLSKDQLSCVDPNTAGTDACKNMDDTVKAQVKSLGDYMISPMTGKGEEKAPEPQAKGEGEAGGEAAGGPAEGETPPE